MNEFAPTKVMSEIEALTDIVESIQRNQRELDTRVLLLENAISAILNYHIEKERFK
jgi:hypothetical protein